MADAGNDRIQRFAADGTCLSRWGSYGGADTTGAEQTRTGAAAMGGKVAYAASRS